MDVSTVRLKYHLVDAGVVVLVLAAFQYWRGPVDPRVVVVAIVYLVVSLAIDFVRNGETAS